jgi:hypothetical protein
MTAEELFESVGFVKEYYSEMADFYRRNFESEEDMVAFFVRVFKNDENDKIPRRMMNQVQHLISIANDMDKIRPGRDPLRIFFIKTCLEALCALSGMNNKKDKPVFYEKFIGFMSAEGKAYILENFSLTRFDDVYMGHTYEASHELTIDDFFEIVKAVRDIVAHEGNYWEMQFFARDDDSTWLASLETERKILKDYEYQYQDRMIRNYSFETTMQYDQFVYYFVEACIAYIVAYIDGKEAEK